MRWRILLVDDDERLARTVSAGLRQHGYLVRNAGSAREGLALVQSWNPDAALLDIMLPDNDSTEIFTLFRAETQAPLLALSARSQVADRVAGLLGGADDYVTKPFSMEELAARLEAVLRRSRGGSRLQVGDLVLDLDGFTARRGGRRVELTRLEHRMLGTLAMNAGRVVQREELVSQLWSAAGSPTSNSLDVHVRRLRGKLEAGGEPRMIHTAHRIGYLIREDGS